MSNIPELKEFPLVNRDQRLPRVYTVDAHPLVHQKYHGRIFILVQEETTEVVEPTEPAATTTTHKEIPETEEEVEKMGFFLINGDDEYVFVRKDGAVDPKDDVLMIFSAKSSSLSAESRNQMQDIQQRMLGDPEDMHIGIQGTAFERDPRVRRNCRGSRCYNLGVTYQKPTTTSAPGAAMKSAYPAPIDLVGDILKVGSSVAMKGLSEKLPEMAQLLNDMAVIYNTPRIGVDENTCYPSFQMNVVPAIPAEERDKRKLADSIGKVGEGHIDQEDSPLVPTCMINLSKPHPDVDVEIFSILGLGVSCLVPEFCRLYFCGLLRHGGKQPFYRSGDGDGSIYYRFTLICYPPRNILQNRGGLAFSHPPNDPLAFSPPTISRNHVEVNEEDMDDDETLKKGRYSRHYSEHRSSWWPEHLPPTAKGQATFLRDGSGIMERRSFINFTVTALLQQCFFQLGQTPESHGLQINPHAFFQAFSYIDADGNRVHPSPPVPGLQESGEGSNVCGSSQDAYHQSQTEDIRKFVEDVKKRFNKALDIRSAAIGNPSSVETERRIKPCKRKRDEEDDAIDKSRNIRSRTMGPSKFPEAPDQDIAMDAVAVHDAQMDEANRAYFQNNSPIGMVPASRLLDCINSAMLTSAINLITVDNSSAASMQSLVFQAISTSPPPLEDCRSMLSLLSSHLRDLQPAFEVLRSSHMLILAYYHLTNVLWWEALECEALASDQPSHWLYNLRKLVEELSISNREARMIYASDVGPEFAQEADVHEVQYLTGCFRLRDMKTSDISKADVDYQMIWILGEFYGIPIRYRYEAIFLRHLLDTLGPTVTLLDPIHDITMSLKYYLNLPQRPTIESLRQHCAQLANVHLSPRLSDETFIVLIDRLEGTTREAYPGLASLFKEVSARYLQPEPPIVSQENVILAPLRSFGEFPVKSHPCIQTLASLVEWLLPLLQDEQPPLALDSQHRGYLNAVKKSTDRLLPFRDHAQSRRRVLEGEGPFSERYLNTRAGFFSALIYRGVTHATSFLQENQTVFKTYEEWEGLYNRLSQTHGTTYFCNASAYGVPIRARSPENVESYWRLSRDPTCHPSSAQSFSDFFKTAKKKFRAFGDLTAFLLASDYAVAGVLSTPSPYEVGKLIHRIDAGAKRGLMLMGYSCDNPEPTALAFQETFEALNHYFSVDEKKKFNFNVFFVEHALCKLTRLTRNGDSGFRELCQKKSIPLPLP